ELLLGGGMGKRLYFLLAALGLLVAGTVVSAAAPPRAHPDVLTGAVSGGKLLSCGLDRERGVALALVTPLGGDKPALRMPLAPAAPPSLGWLAPAGAFWCAPGYHGAGPDDHLTVCRLELRDLVAGRQVPFAKAPPLKDKEHIPDLGHPTPEQDLEFSGLRIEF